MVGGHWRFTKSDFVECPVCRSVTHIKISNVAKHFKKAHTHQPESVNQLRGCQGCGAKDVSVQMLEDHQGCGLKKSMEVKSANEHDASQQATKENHVELTPSKLSQENGSKWISLNYKSEVNGLEEMKVRRMKSVEEPWVKENVGRWKRLKVHRSDLKYLYQGKEVDGGATPLSLGMQDGDVVTVEMRDKEENISIKFVDSATSDTIFVRTVTKTTRMKEIKGNVSRFMGVERSEIKLIDKDKEVGLYTTPALLLMKQNDVISVSDCREALSFQIGPKRKDIDGFEQGTHPKVQKLNQDVSKDPEISKLMASPKE